MKTEKLTTETSDNAAKLDKATALAGDLIAIIRINHLRGTFATASREDIEAFLAPQIERLKEIRGDSRAAHPTKPKDAGLAATCSFFVRLSVRWLTLWAWKRSIESLFDRIDWLKKHHDNSRSYYESCSEEQEKEIARLRFLLISMRASLRKMKGRDRTRRLNWP